MEGPKRLLRGARSAPGKVFAFWTSRPLLLAAVAGLIATIVAFGSMKTMAWMETEDFCGRCHTMQPEVAAHADSPHEDVACAECHVGSGLMGLVKSKWGGMQQAVKLLTGRYPRPIPPAAHGMPPANETCLRCHNPARQRANLLITRSYFQEDQQNTEQRVALVVRLSGDPEQHTSGIHWHVLSDVEYLTRDPAGQVIDWIGVTHPDGSHEEFISQNVVMISGQAGQEAADLRQTGDVRRMSCYDCHNRVGHELLTANSALDEALAAGSIDPDLPFIKKRGLEVLSAKYSSLAEADRAIDGLAESYHRDYPNLFLEKPGQIKQALQTLALIYRQTASPNMQAFSATYPSYMGHTDSTGCFRCHDGGHFKIVDGRLSNEPIPSRCDLCHTFPSVGARAPNVMLGPPPASHQDRLWVFNHKVVAGSTDVTNTSCSACHSQTYCTNCHSTGAVKVKHDNMLFDHASVVRETGQQACAYCHQKPFCDQCHVKNKITVGP